MVLDSGLPKRGLGGHVLECEIFWHRAERLKVLAVGESNWWLVLHFSTEWSRFGHENRQNRQDLVTACGYFSWLSAFETCLRISDFGWRYQQKNRKFETSPKAKGFLFPKPDPCYTLILDPMGPLWQSLDAGSRTWVEFPGNFDAKRWRCYRPVLGGPFWLMIARLASTYGSSGVEVEMFLKKNMLQKNDLDNEPKCIDHFFMNHSGCHATPIIVSYIQLWQSYAKTGRHWAKMESC